MARKVTFQLAAGVNRVVTEARELLHSIVVEADGLTTSDPHVIAALDAHPGVVRSQAATDDTPAAPAADDKAQA